MNIAVFGLAACVFGTGQESPADPGSIWIKFQDNENAKNFGKDHPIFQESNTLYNMFFTCGSVEMCANDYIGIQYDEYAFDIVAGLLKEESEAESDDIPISFEQLLHVFDLMNYLDFNKDATKHINNKLFHKTLDGKNAENIFAAPRNNGVHTPLAYFLCLKAYTETHDLHMCIKAAFSAVTICAHDTRDKGINYGSDRRLPFLHHVRILPEVYNRYECKAMGVGLQYKKPIRYVVSIILKICKEAGIEELDVSDCMLHLNDFEVLGKMKSLKLLNISKNELSKDGIKEIFKLASLEVLSMMYCRIEKQHEFDGIENMTSLKYLNHGWEKKLSNNSVKAIFKLTSLEVLILNNCGIEKDYKFDGIGAMNGLKQLNLKDNRLSKDSIKELFNLVSLEVLILDECRIEKYYKFDGIDTMKGLKYLDLSNNELSNNSMKEIFELTNLEGLKMEKCGMKQKDDLDGIDKMAFLKHLDLSNNELSKDSMKAIFKLTNLEGLTMKKCGIKKDHKFDGIDQMASLKHLDLSKNELSNNILKEIFKLVSLKELSVTECGIENAHGLDGIDKLNGLKYLNISDNKLSENSMKEIFKLSSLERLIMEKCGIEEDYSLEGLANLVNLVWLAIGIDSLSDKQKEFIQSLNIGSMLHQMDWARELLLLSL